MAYKHMPVDLVLVRHGESEGNLAQSRAKLGDDAAWHQQAFRDRHNSQYRLTDTGREQARAAGSWVKEHLGGQFDRFYTSEYVRALETAALLNMDCAKWNTQHFLRERDRGVLSNKSHAERRRWHAEEVERQMRDPFYYQPPGGESIANVCIRVESVINTIQRECSGLRCLVVCHGGIIKAFRALLEREQRPLSPGRSSTSHPSTSPAMRKIVSGLSESCRKTELSDEMDALYPGSERGSFVNGKNLKKIYNGQVVHYTRRNPVTGEVHSKLQWVRSICPWRDPTEPSAFEEFCTVRYSNEELLDRVRLIPQLVNGPMDLSFDEAGPPPSNGRISGEKSRGDPFLSCAESGASSEKTDQSSNLSSEATTFHNPNTKVCASGDDDVCSDVCVPCRRSDKSKRMRDKSNHDSLHLQHLSAGGRFEAKMDAASAKVDTGRMQVTRRAPGTDELSPVSPDLRWD